MTWLFLQSTLTDCQWHGLKVYGEARNCEFDYLSISAPGSSSKDAPLLEVSNSNRSRQNYTPIDSFLSHFLALMHYL
jgi:hypothetical protein